MGVPGRPSMMTSTRASAGLPASARRQKRRPESALQGHAVAGAAILPQPVEQFVLPFGRRFGRGRKVGKQQPSEHSGDRQQPSHGQLPARPHRASSSCQGTAARTSAKRDDPADDDQHRRAEAGGPCPFRQVGQGRRYRSSAAAWCRWRLPPPACPPAGPPRSVRARNRAEVGQAHVDDQRGIGVGQALAQLRSSARSSRQWPVTKRTPMARPRWVSGTPVEPAVQPGSGGDAGHDLEGDAVAGQHVRLPRCRARR